MSLKVMRWANDWIIESGRLDSSLLSDSCVVAEVARFVSDAEAQGISKTELTRALGNLEAYILEEYERKLNEEHAERQGRGD